MRSGQEEAAMSRIKGTDVVNLTHFVRGKGPQVESDFLAGLTEPLRRVYVETRAITWTPVETQAALYEAAASYFFPNRPDAIVQLHRALAKIAYSGIYQIFIRIPKLSHIAERAASVWRRYYDTGEAGIENLTATSLDFVVSQCPDLPRALRQATTGHLYTLMEMTGAKDLVVSQPADTPAKWVWHIEWRG
jgi:hypothetical protein